MASIGKYASARLGAAITAARLAIGMAKQSDLASSLGVSQQTVSRWEAGVARPNAKQLDLLAAVLKLNASDLRRLVGAEAPPAVSFVEPLPVDRLPPTTFEQFVADLVQEENPAAEVRRAGGSGHVQDGLDVEAILQNGSRIGLQCKRVLRFGPHEAEAAIAAFSADGYEKILVLSRVASPQTAEVVRSHPGWRLWDKDDLSRRMRKLPMDVQERLVDIYFRGQRQALLGRSESGPWLTVEEFFRPFDSPDLPLNHNWRMLGREVELTELQAAMTLPGVRLIVIVASGGMGKSRLLKEAMITFGKREPSVCIRFLSGSANPSRQALDDLGPGPKVLVIDDAHDRDGLGVLFEYAADPSHQTRLILATRDYARERILNEAAVYNITSPPSIILKILGRNQLRAIATQVLAHFKLTDPDLAKYVVAASGDSPMIVAMAAQVLAKDNVPVELAKRQDEFRRVVLGKFAKVVSGHLGNAGDEKVHRDIMDVLALIQPFHPEDSQLLALLEQVQGISKSRVSNALSRLSNGGVIYRRGHQWRLMPDVLGDYLMETSCVDSSGRLSSFAGNVLATVQDTLLKNALVNLGRMDWRRSAGDTTSSDLLSGVWRTLDDIANDYDPRLDAIKSVALYQPRQALAFAVRQARRGKSLRALPEILKGIARSSDYLEEVMELLWDIGRNDSRELGPNPSHAVRVLTELGNYEGHKPLFYCQTLLEFGLRLSEDDANWLSRYTPFDVLRPLLSSEGTNNSCNGRTYTLDPYYISYDVVKPLRARVINRTIELLRHGNFAIARTAGSFVSSALRYPMGIVGSTPPTCLRAALAKEFVDTLEKLQAVIGQGVHPLVVLAIANSVSWHANFGGGKPGAVARAILDNLPRDIHFRLLATLVDGWGHTFVERQDASRWQSNLEEWLGSVVTALESAKPDPQERLAYIGQTLADLKEAGETRSSSHMVLQKLVADIGFSRAMVEDALTRTSSLTRVYAGGALSELLRRHKAEGRAYAARMIESTDRELTSAVAIAYAGMQLDDEDKVYLQRLLSSSDFSTLYHAIHAVWLSRSGGEADAIQLLLYANITEDAKLIDEVAMVFCGGGGCGRLVEAVTEGDAKVLLQRIAPAAQLEGYWIDELLAEFSFRFPFLTAEFFMDRCELAAQRESYSFRAANFGPYSHRRLRFLESDKCLDVLEGVWRWLRRNGSRDHYFQYAAAHTFQAMFLRSTNKLIEFFTSMLPSADAGDLRLMGQILREADHAFVFAHTGFVIAMLDCCRRIDFELHQLIWQQLYCSAQGGMRSGMLGEPMPRDLEDKSKSEEVLAKLSRLSSAYELFDAIRRSANTEIERTKLDAEGYDE